jgi:hypothetical protein
MVDLRINDVKLDVNFLMHYQLVQIEREILFLITFSLLFTDNLFLEAMSTPSHLINPSTLSAEKYAGK